MKVEVYLPGGRVVRATVQRGSPWDSPMAWARYAGTSRPRLWQRGRGDVVIDARGPVRRVRAR